MFIKEIKMKNKVLGLALCALVGCSAVTMAFGAGAFCTLKNCSDNCAGSKVGVSHSSYGLLESRKDLKIDDINYTECVCTKGVVILAHPECNAMGWGANYDSALKMLRSHL